VNTHTDGAKTVTVILTTEHYAALLNSK